MLSDHKITGLSRNPRCYLSKDLKSPAESVLYDLTNQFPEYSKALADLYTKLNPKLETAIEDAKRLQKQNGR